MPKLDEIEAAYGEGASRLLTSWYRYQDRTRGAEEDVAGPHADLMTPEQRSQAVRRQKAARAAEQAKAYQEEYRELTEERNDAIRARTNRLKKEFYSAPNAEVLSRAITATDGQLREMLETGMKVGATDLAKAAFVAAEQRGLGEIMAAYLEANPGARETYEELKAAPGEEEMERKLADGEKLFQAPTAFDLAPTYGTAH